MGLNISVYKVTGKTMEELWTKEIVPYYRLEEQKWFDYCRYSGDREFVLNNDFTAIDTDRDDFEQELMRPSNFNKMREWIRLNVFEGNQERLLNALDKMEEDESLVFTWSW